MVTSRKEGAEAYYRHILIFLDESKENSHRNSKLSELAREVESEVMKHDRSKGKKVMYHFLFA